MTTVRNLFHKPVLEFFTPAEYSGITFPSVGKVNAGFPSPADDYMDKQLSLDEHLIKNRYATIIAEVNGNSMVDAFIFDGDVLVIDKDVQPEHGDIVICRLDGEFTCKRIDISKKVVRLVAENQDFEPIIITDENDFIVEGVVTWIIHKARNRNPRTPRKKK